MADTIPAKSWIVLDIKMLRRQELVAIEKEQKEQELVRKVEGKRLADLEAELWHIAFT